jgi:hypothetical protein
MAIIRAKFRLTEIKKTTNWAGTVHETDAVALYAVMDAANKSWSQWTPYGQLDMTINNPDALNKLKIGQTYFVDLTEAPATEANEVKG